MDYGLWNIPVRTDPKFNKTDTTYQQVNLGMVAYLGAVLTLYVGTRYCHHSCMCHKYHIKHKSKECNLDRLKSGLKRDTNETPTCAVPMHAPQTNALWWGEEVGTNKAPLYSLPRRVGLGVCGC